MQLGNQASAEAPQATPLPDRPVRNAFPNAREVRLFVEIEYPEGGQPIYSKPHGLKLSQEQRIQLESLLFIHTISPDDDFYGCFAPHHFFRYFDATGKLLGEFQVCFCCEGVQESGASNIEVAKGEMLSTDYDKLKAFVRSLGERTDVQCEGPA
jgi:hypothetical protein